MANGNSSNAVPVRLKQYAAQAGARNLAADSPDTRTCARMIKILGAGSFTGAKDAAGNLHGDGTLGPLTAGSELVGEFSEVISADAAFIAFY